jgi:hypothetical protein
MSTGTIVVIVVVIIVIALAIGVAATVRRRRLQQQFGPEYDRLAQEHDSKRKAEAELAQRQRRVRKLDIRPLSPEAQQAYAARWTTLQERFVDDPEDAVAQSQTLVAEVMRERGYPTEHRDQVAADLSVEHAKTIGNFRAAEEISQKATSGTASTEDLRQAMIHYRALFRDLLGDTPEPGSEHEGTMSPGAANGRIPAGADPVDRDVAAGTGTDELSRDGVSGDPVASDELSRDGTTRGEQVYGETPRGETAGDPAVTRPAEQAPDLSDEEPVTRRTGRRS